MAGKTTKKAAKIKEASEAPQEEKILSFQKSPDGTIELRMVLSWGDIKTTREKVVDEMAKSANLPGFRTGKAPKKLVEEKLDQAKIKDEIIRTLLPQAYAKAIKDNNIRPIMDPQIHIDGQLDEGKDWMFHALTCEAPTIDLGNYKEEIKKITAKSKIVVPGKEPEAPKLEEIIKTLLENAKIVVPRIIVEKEADRLLSQTLDEIKRLGMTLDQYLASTGRKAEDLRAEYANKAQNDLKLEFALQRVSETEKISVEESEIEKTITNAKPEERPSLQANKYLLASIIRQQKTLDFLKSL